MRYKVVYELLSMSSKPKRIKWVVTAFNMEDAIDQIVQKAEGMGFECNIISAVRIGE
jgi:hypothetical protein